ncbi:hypothetical protein SAMN04489760_12413 [Syntrophus gentianae]|uniref:Uncharacterized protein n=1 Tax=Syntrophus gentianae TaxID=43775 RepID=A0A1H7ZII3_9BACT|nr:hypothetical protein SAMN04489760_12413 [Syntrophus gentianae]
MPLGRICQEIWKKTCVVMGELSNRAFEMADKVTPVP